jgi:RimJ/RimL family protein N-acetyltransferase
MDVRAFEATAALRDNRPLRIRAIRPSDKAALRAGFRRLSRQSVYFRFHGVKRALSERELVYFTEIDFRGHVALVAALIDGGQEHLVGVGRYVESDRTQRTRRAELAFAVDEDHQGLGVASVLLKCLTRIGRKQGIEEFIAFVLPENQAMIDVFHHSGLPVRQISGGDALQLSVMLG